MFDQGSQAIEVAIGLVFVYLLFSVICSAFQEGVATALAWRSKDLEMGIQRLLRHEQGTGIAERVIKNDRVQALISPRRRLRVKPSAPSYLSSRTFALALLDTLVPADRKGAGSRDLLAEARVQVGVLTDAGLKRELTLMIDAADEDLDRFRTEVEHWYDDMMNRVSGWYKRRAQTWLAVFAIAVAAVGNVDTIYIANRLWDDAPLRAAIVARAEQAKATDPPPDLKEVKSELDSSIPLPVGWTTADKDPREFVGSIDGEKLLGILISALAISVGAPFWFDALGKLSRLRATGKPEGRTPGSANP